MQDLEQRVQRLEKENRRLRRGMALAALAIAATVLMGPSGSENKQTLRAGAFELVDDGGELRGSLAFADGRPGLTLLDGGKPVAALTLESDGPGLALFDGNGNVRARVGVNARENTSFVGLIDANRETRVTLRDQGTARLADSIGRTTWEAPPAP